MLLGDIEMVFVFGEPLREDAENKSAVVAQACAVLCRPLGVKSYFHHLFMVGLS